jgi:hypothetical protein
VRVPFLLGFKALELLQRFFWESLFGVMEHFSSPFLMEKLRSADAKWHYDFLL